MFELLKDFDYPVLRLLNVTLAHPALDQFWLILTQMHKHWWARALVAPTLLIWFVARLRLQAWKPLVMVAFTVALTDSISYRIIKSAVGRPRPFDNAEVSTWVRKVGQAHGASFPSNHAANCFAAAGVLTWYFTRRRNWFYLGALLVALSRPALGVHYPTDVLAGAVLGSTVAFFVNSLIITRVRALHLSAGETTESGDWRKRFEHAGPPRR